MTRLQINRTETKELKNWADAQGNRFEVIGLYSPSDDNDTWIEYRKSDTGDTFNCRFEAFESRFFPLMD
jgi:hypothetical protein